MTKMNDDPLSDVVEEGAGTGILADRDRLAARVESFRKEQGMDLVNTQDVRPYLKDKDRLLSARKDALELAIKSRTILANLTTVDQLIVEAELFYNFLVKSD